MFYTYSILFHSKCKKNRLFKVTLSSALFFCANFSKPIYESQRKMFTVFKKPCLIIWQRFDDYCNQTSIY